MNWNLSFWARYFSILDKKNLFFLALWLFLIIPCRTESCSCFCFLLKFFNHLILLPQDSIIHPFVFWCFPLFPVFKHFSNRKFFKAFFFKFYYKLLLHSVDSLIDFILSSPLKRVFCFFLYFIFFNIECSFNFKRNLINIYIFLFVLCLSKMRQTE